MKINNYCLVVFGEFDINDVKSLVIYLSEGTPVVLDATGMSISTFHSFLRVNELKDEFSTRFENFLLFKTDKNSFDYDMTNEEWSKLLFENIKPNEDLDKLSKRFMEDINKDMMSPSDEIPEIKLSLETREVKSEVRPNLEYFRNLSKVDRESKINELLDMVDRGELNEYHEEILQLLVEINSKKK